jgi:hypothetical protein
MKNKFFFVLLTIILILVAVRNPILATDYYVSPTGNDKNDGKARTAAWATISKVNSINFSAGDKILFESGKTFLGNLIFDADDGGSATNSLILGTFFSFEGGNANGNDWATINGGNGHGIQITGSIGVTVRNIMVIGSGRNTNYLGIGVLVDSAKDIVIDKVEVEGFQLAGIMIYGGSANVRISNVYAHDNGYTGIGVGYEKEGENKNIYIGYCRTIHNPGISDSSKYIGDQSGSGINLGNVEGGLIEYCESADNGGDFYHAQGNGPVGIWLYLCKDVTIQYCISHNNKSRRISDGHIYSDGGGFDFDSGLKNCTIQYCYSYENAGPGFQLCAWDTTEADRIENATLRYSISENDGLNSGAGIWIWHSIAQHNMQVYNNVIYNSSGRCCVKSPGIEGSFFFWNNIFVIRGTGAFIEGMEPNAVFQGNCYWNYNNPGIWDGAVSLEAWRKRGQETLNKKLTGINKDPLLTFDFKGEKLTDPTKILLLNEYLLKPGSPCIDAGLNLLRLFEIDPGMVDFFGNKLPQNKKYDIGIHDR